MEKQILLLPEVINLAPTPLEMILENVELLSDIGFIIEPFGEGMIIVREVPALIGDADIKQIIIDLGDDLSSDWVAHFLSRKSRFDIRKHCLS